MSVERIFEQCRGCLGEGLIESTVPCSCNEMAEKPVDFKCPSCDNIGLIKSATQCKICRGKGKVDITGPRKVDIDDIGRVVSGKCALNCPFQNNLDLFCIADCTCFSIKLSQDNRRYYAVCQHHNPDFIIGEVDVKEQMLEVKF